MAGQRVLDYDPFTGVTSTFEYNADTGNVVLGYHQDASAVIEANKSRKINIDKSKATAKRDMLHYARVPVIAQYDMLMRHGVDFWNRDHRKKVMGLLNSSEYEYCRISHVKHDR